MSVGKGRGTCNTPVINASHACKSTWQTSTCINHIKKGNYFACQCDQAVSEGKFFHHYLTKLHFTVSKAFSCSFHPIAFIMLIRGLLSPFVVELDFVFFTRYGIFSVFLIKLNTEPFQFLNCFTLLQKQEVTTVRKEFFTVPMFLLPTCEDHRALQNIRILFHSDKNKIT